MVPIRIFISSVQSEFDRATERGVHRLIFLNNLEDSARHPKMQALIGKSQSSLVRRRFHSPEELKTGLYAALVKYLEIKELIRQGPFDAAPCADAALDDLDFERMAGFVRTARRARQFPLTEDVPPQELLTHLNLLNKGRPTNAAVLLFGKAPQRFLIASEIKCAHFHGVEVAKPIPSYQIYKGTAFQLVDQAVDFVLGKIDRAIGTRAGRPNGQSCRPNGQSRRLHGQSCRLHGQSCRLHGQSRRRNCCKSECSVSWLAGRCRRRNLLSTLDTGRFRANSTK